MNWKKIAPWKWFKDEEASVPATRAAARIEGDPFSALRTDMDRLLDDMLDRFSARGRVSPSLPRWIPAPLRPSVDISEGRKAYTVRAELPGMELEDIAIEVDDHTLGLRGEKRQESEEEDEGYHCVERSYGAVQRVLSLPDDADCEAIDARFKNGVLTLKIPKHAPKASQGRRIEIQQG
jgi:HSP20 family protein